jgi:hypothetical protein
MSVGRINMNDTSSNGAAASYSDVGDYAYGGRHIHEKGIEAVPPEVRERWVDEWSVLREPKPLWEVYEAHRAVGYHQIVAIMRHRKLPTGEPPAPRMAIPNEARELPLGPFRFVCVAKAIAQLRGRGGYMAQRQVRGVDAKDIAWEVGVHERTVKRWAIEALPSDLVRFPPKVMDGRGAWTGFDLGARLKYPTHSFFFMPLAPVLDKLWNQEVAILGHLGSRGAWEVPVRIPQSELCRAIGLTPRHLNKIRKRPAGEDNLRNWIVSLEKRGLIEVTEGHCNSYQLRELLPN